MMSNKLAKSIESIWFWMLCILIGGGVAGGLGASHILPWIFAAIAGLVTTVVLGLGALVGIHPFVKRSIRAQLPHLLAAHTNSRELIQTGLRLAGAENDAELRRIAEKRDRRFAEVAEWRDKSNQEITTRTRNEVNRIRIHAEEETAAAKQQLTRNLQDTEQIWSGKLQQAELQQQTLLESKTKQFTEEQDQLLHRINLTGLGGSYRLRVGLEKAHQWMKRDRSWSDEFFPTWDRLATDDGWPSVMTHPVLPLGSASISSKLPRELESITGEELVSRIHFEPFDDQYLTITADPNHPTVKQLIKSLLLRALSVLPAGKTQVCVVDPPGLGRDYGWLMHLADYNPDLVSHRVWTQPVHIAKQLGLLAQSAENFIQQSLRNVYATIEEYNRDAGPLAEPFRILVWTAFPAGLDDQSWKSLQSLLDTGARCGIIPILIIDPAQSWDVLDREEFIKRRGVHLTLDESGNLRINRPALADLSITPAEAPAEPLDQEIVHKIGRKALLASRVEVPLSGIAPKEPDWWKGDSSGCFEIPIGQSGVGRVQSLKLGVGTAQHAIIAGKTGSGKSTMLHAIITSAAVKYSPERLRLVLLDFKKGVEFQSYAQAELPHADIIGIESHREFGLSALEYVDQCMQNRGEMFRKAGVQDLPSWNLIKPDQQLPRMLIVIDEFQELFVEDDKLSNQVSLILDRIVRQGRSFGVHAVLSSQTLAGAYTLARTTMGQMGVRIALQCDAADAQIIFADDNPAAARLNHPGQAVYNDQGGRIEGNQPMQIGWLGKSEMMDWLGKLPSGYRNADLSTNILGRAVVYDGNRPAAWDGTAVRRAVDAARTQLNPDACWCVLGESVAISPAITFPITEQAGRNMLLVGTEERQAAAVMLSIAGTFATQYRAEKAPHIYCVQAAKPTDASCLSLTTRLKSLDCDISTTDVRGADGLIGELHSVLKTRMDNSDAHAEWAPSLLILVNIGRLRSLRPEDEFGLGSFGESKQTPDKQLEELLREGPSHRIHTLIYGENANTIARWLSRQAMRELEVRLLMQMSANDSTHLVDSVAASHLGTNVMMLHDDATSTESRFRPYAFDSLGDFRNLSEATRQK
ncbi:MAG: FtsK/SpoIIIE domain-containing protein [Pirellulales bacterium]